MGLGVAVALLATSMPAMARPGYGWGGGWNGPGYGHGWGGGHRYRHRGGLDFGDFLLGAVIIGGIAAVAADASNRGSSSRRDGAYGNRGDDADQNGAVDACAAAAERQASRYSSDARVTDISMVSRDGDGWRVEGTVASDDGRDYRDSRSFQCGVRHGRVDFLQLGDQTAFR